MSIRQRDRCETRQKLESIYLNLKQRADIEFAVVTVDTTGDQDIFEYSLAVARGWGIGSKGGDKNGFLLIVAIKDRKYFTQVSDHLEGDLNGRTRGRDSTRTAGSAIQKGNYSQGIYDTVQAYVATLAEKRSFTIEGIDQSYAYREARRSSDQQFRWGNFFVLHAHDHSSSSYWLDTRGVATRRSGWRRRRSTERFAYGAGNQQRD